MKKWVEGKLVDMTPAEIEQLKADAASAQPAIPPEQPSLPVQLDALIQVMQDDGMINATRAASWRSRLTKKWGV